MKVIDVHPEELLDREQRGMLTHEQRDLLDAHLASCESCRLERLLRADFADEAARASEADMQSFVLGALETVASGEVASAVVANAAQVDVGSASGERGTSTRRAATWLLVACVLLIAAGAAASRSAWVERMFHVTFGEAAIAPSQVAAPKLVNKTRASKPEPEAHAEATAPIVNAPVAEAKVVAQAITPPSEPVERPPVLEGDALRTTLARVPSALQPRTRGSLENTYRPAPRTARITNVRTPRAVLPETKPAVASSTVEPLPSPVVQAAPEPAPDPARIAAQAAASALFEQANRARRSGKLDQAATLYEQLQREHAGSAEAKLSFALSARMWLDAGNAFAAYGAFERYLASGDRALREEAMTGRALALDRLGRKSAADAAFAELLQAYPYSSYAPLAKKRLGQD